jgi:hypothetical protein
MRMATRHTEGVVRPGLGRKVNGEIPMLMIPPHVRLGVGYDFLADRRPNRNHAQDQFWRRNSRSYCP